LWFGKPPNVTLLVRNNKLMHTLVWNPVQDMKEILQQFNGTPAAVSAQPTVNYALHDCGTST
jgi:hypothetical protein